jgi:hypothetical protein
VAEFAELFPNTELVVQPEAGHHPWLDDPDRFVATTATFPGMKAGSVTQHSLGGRWGVLAANAIGHFARMTPAKR